MNSRSNLLFNAVVSALLALMISSAAVPGTAFAQSGNQASPATSNAMHLRLKDRLDRPQDGYCFDILGTPGNMRLDLPLFAHNCKTRLTPDSAVVFDSMGRIVFPAVNGCVTIAGVNSVALPGASVLVRECDEASPFFEAAKLQRFSFGKEGQLELVDSGLCLAVGATSATTYSPADRWRSLFVDDCRSVESSRARWELIKP
jgi:hypothetical protein